MTITVSVAVSMTETVSGQTFATSARVWACVVFTPAPRPQINTSSQVAVKVNPLDGRSKYFRQKSYFTGSPWMSEINAGLSYDVAQVTIAEIIGDLPAHAENDNSGIKLPAFK